MPEIESINADLPNSNQLSIHPEYCKKWIQYLNITLLGVVQVMFQGGIPSAFETHPIILSFYTVTIVICACAWICYDLRILPSPIADSYLAVLGVTAILMGALSVILLVTLIVPVFGWIVFGIWVLVACWGVYKLIRPAIDNVVTTITSFLPS